MEQWAEGHRAYASVTNVCDLMSRSRIPKYHVYMYVIPHTHRHVPLSATDPKVREMCRFLGTPWEILHPLHIGVFHWYEWIELDSA